MCGETQKKTESGFGKKRGEKRRKTNEATSMDFNTEQRGKQKKRL
jgi:hypothetical protein